MSSRAYLCGFDECAPPAAIVRGIKIMDTGRIITINTLSTASNVPGVTGQANQAIGLLRNYLQDARV